MQRLIFYGIKFKIHLNSESVIFDSGLRHGSDWSNGLVLKSLIHVKQ